MARAGVKDLHASGYEHERSLDCLKLIKSRVTFPSCFGEVCTFLCVSNEVNIETSLLMSSGRTVLNVTHAAAFDLPSQVKQHQLLARN